MARAAHGGLEWRRGEETSCPACGTRYRVDTAQLRERRDGYAKCEACGVLMDEWICDQARRYVRIAAPASAPTVAAPQPSASGL